MKKSEVSSKLSLSQVVKASGLSPVYVRRAILTGKLATVKEPVSEGSKVVRHMIEQADFDTWRSSTKAHSRREDGRSKFTLYATEAELESLQGLVTTAQLTTIIQRANKTKQTAAVETEADEL